MGRSRRALSSSDKKKKKKKDKKEMKKLKKKAFLDFCQLFSEKEKKAKKKEKKLRKEMAKEVVLFCFPFDVEGISGALNPQKRCAVSGRKICFRPCGPQNPGSKLGRVRF